MHSDLFSRARSDAAGPRRRFPLRVGTVAIALSALMALFGFVGTSAASASSKGNTPTRGGTLTVDLSEDLSCVDPQVSPLYGTYEISRNVVDSLVAQKGSGYDFVHWLATSWTISSDAEHYTFQLRQGVVFSDGTPFNAEAVKYNFDRIINPATKSTTAAELLGPYQSTTVLGPYTVEVNFSQPYAVFLQGLATPWLGIESPTYLSASSYQPCSPPVGSGPYEVSSYTPNEQETLVRNPHYGDWAPSIYTHTGPGYLSKLVYNLVPDDSTRVGALISGQAQVIQDTPVSQVTTVEADGFKVIKHDQAGVPYSLGINIAQPPTNDPLVREAFRDAIDVNGIVNGLLLNEYTRAWAPLSPTTLDYDPHFVNSWSQNVAKANKLLNEDGYTKRNSSGFREKDGKVLTILYSDTDTRQDRPEIALYIQQEEAKIGIDVVLLQNEAQASVFNIFGNMYVRDDPDQLRLFFDGEYTLDNGKGDNATNINNSTLNGWLQAASGTLNQTTRAALEDKIQNYLINNYDIIPLYNLGTLYATTSNFHGATLDSNGWLQYYDAYLSK